MQDTFARARTRPKGRYATIGYLVYKGQRFKGAGRVIYRKWRIEGEPYQTGRYIVVGIFYYVYILDSS